VREGIRSLLEDHPDLKVVGSVGDGLMAIYEAERLNPDVVVMDITMPGVNGIDATRAIAGKRPGAAVIMFSMHSSPIIVKRAMDAGARGYLHKETPIKEVVKAVRAVASGKTYFAPGVTSPATAGPPMRGGGAEEALTGPERRILKLVAEGKSNPEIAELIGLTRRTVETYRLRLMRKLGLDNLPALVRYAIRHGIITLE
jgi:DNA-binding NarL/FixJ family response regulator